MKRAVEPATSLSRLEPASAGRPVVAFFDLDRTLLPHHTALLYLRQALTEGRVGWWTLIRAALFLTLYFFNKVDTERVVRGVVKRAAGDLDEDGRARGERCVERLVIPRLSRSAVERVEWHRAAGHALCILSASPQYVVAPIAERLGMTYECTRFASSEGRLTGELDGPMCYGVHKRDAAERYAKRAGARLEDCWFYSDSASDLPLLEAVGNPVAVNPDLRLRSVARERHWSIVAFV